MVLIEVEDSTRATTSNYGAMKETPTRTSTTSVELKSTLRTESEESDNNPDHNEHVDDPGTAHNNNPSEDHPKPRSKFTTRQILILISLSFFNFTSYTCMSILGPIFPREAQNKGLTVTLIGLIFGVYAFIIFVASPFMGIVVSRVGPKCVFITGGLLTGSCTILFGLINIIESTETFTIVCFAVRILWGFGTAALTTAGFAYIAEVFPNQIGQIWGIQETFVGLGYSAGPVIGGVLYDYGGFGLPFYTAGGLMLLALPLNFFILPYQTLTENAVSGRELSTWKLLKIPGILIVVITIIVAENSRAFLEPTLEPHLREFGLSATELGVIFMLMSVMYGLSSTCWGYIFARLKYPWFFFAVGMLFTAIGLILLGPSPLIDLPNMIWLNIFALVINGLFTAMVLLPTFESMLNFAQFLVRFFPCRDVGYRDDVSTYGLIAGLWSSVYSLGEVLGLGIGSGLTEKFGFPVTSTIMAFVCLLNVILVLVYFLLTHKKPRNTTYILLETDETMPVLQPRFPSPSKISNSSHSVFARN